MLITLKKEILPLELKNINFKYSSDLAILQ